MVSKCPKTREAGCLFKADLGRDRHHPTFSRRESQLAPVQPPTHPSQCSQKRDRCVEAAPIEGGRAAAARPLTHPCGVLLEEGGGEGGFGAEGDALVEGAVFYGREGGGQGNLAEGGAAREGVAADGGEGGGEGDLAEGGVVRERKRVDGGEGSGERELSERGAACLGGKQGRHVRGPNG